MTPKETLEKLKKTTNERCHRSLELIYEVCLDQQKSGVNNFSVANIAKIGASRGIPKAQSIRNSTGDAYRTLIDSFSKSNGKNTSTFSTKKNDWIEKIKDPNTRLLVRSQEADLKKAEKLIREFIPIKTIIEVTDFTSEKPYSPLSPLERRALEHILSPEFEKKLNLTKGKQGQMTINNGELLFKSATIDAIKKALNFL